MMVVQQSFARAGIQIKVFCSLTFAGNPSTIDWISSNISNIANAAASSAMNTNASAAHLKTL